MMERTIECSNTTVNPIMVKEEEDSRNFFEIDIGHGWSVLESIEEEGEESEGSLFSIDIKEHRVFVAVGKNESSMVALLWTLKHATTPSSNVHLIHVFPVLRLVPSPCKLLSHQYFQICLVPINY